MAQDKPQLNFETAFKDIKSFGERLRDVVKEIQFKRGHTDLIKTTRNNVETLLKDIEDGSANIHNLDALIKYFKCGKEYFCSGFKDVEIFWDQERPTHIQDKADLKNKIPKLEPTDITKPAIPVVFYRATLKGATVWQSVLYDDETEQYHSQPDAEFPCWIDESTEIGDSGLNLRHYLHKHTTTDVCTFYGGNVIYYYVVQNVNKVMGGSPVRIYVGKGTSGIKQRWNQHCIDAEKILKSATDAKDNLVDIYIALAHIKRCKSALFVVHEPTISNLELDAVEDEIMKDHRLCNMLHGLNFKRNKVNKGEACTDDGYSSERKFLLGALFDKLNQNVQAEPSMELTMPPVFYRTKTDGMSWQCVTSDSLRMEYQTKPHEFPDWITGNIKDGKRGDIDLRDLLQEETSTNVFTFYYGFSIYYFVIKNRDDSSVRVYVGQTESGIRSRLLEHCQQVYNILQSHRECSDKEQFTERNKTKMLVDISLALAHFSSQNWNNSLTSGVFVVYEVPKKYQKNGKQDTKAMKKELQTKAEQLIKEHELTNLQKGMNREGNSAKDVNTPKLDSKTDEGDQASNNTEEASAQSIAVSDQVSDGKQPTSTTVTYGFKNKDENVMKCDGFTYYYHIKVKGGFIRWQCTERKKKCNGSVCTKPGVKDGEKMLKFEVVPPKGPRLTDISAT